MIKIVYWSQSGCTKEMADAIATGILANGKEAKVLEVSSVSVQDLQSESVFALGCPAMGAEVLEEDEMEPFVAEMEQFVSGKTIGLFGSYGWGDGEWMRNWVDRMQSAGATVIGGEGVICQGTPDEDGVKACNKLGAKLASV